MEELTEFYRTYGEALASRLAGIAHSDATPGFVFVEDMGDPSEVLDFIGKGKADDGQNVLVWEHFVEDLDTGGRDNYHSALKGSVAVIRKVKDKDRTLIRQAHATGRQLCLKALGLMLQDSQDGALYEQTIQVDVRNLSGEKITALGVSWYGYILQLNWTVPIDLDLTETDLTGLA